MEDAKRERTGQAARTRSGVRVAIGVLAIGCLALLVMQVLQARQPPPLPTGTVAGVVVDESGRPVQGEVVVIGAEVETKTDAQGRFELGGVPVGAQEIAVLDSMAAHAFPVAVQAGATVDMGTLRVVATRVPDA